MTITEDKRQELELVYMGNTFISKKLWEELHLTNNQGDSFHWQKYQMEEHELEEGKVFTVVDTPECQIFIGRGGVPSDMTLIKRGHNGNKMWGHNNIQNFFEEVHKLEKILPLWQVV